MQLDHNSFYQSRITPWYDSTPLCWIFILMGAAFLIFGITGIFTAAESPIYMNFLWVPCLISTLSLIVIIKISVRLIRRNRSA